MLEFKPRSYDAGPFYCAEVVQCIGPQSLTEVGSGSYADLYGAVWRLVLDRKRGLILSQRQLDGWLEVLPDQPFPELPKQARKIGLAFDQVARPVLSYQIDESIYIRQWNPAAAAYEYQTFTGVDPVILMDVAVHQRSEDSDVMCWFLSLDRLTLFSVLQRDSYQFPIQRAVLSESAWLDQVAAMPYVVQVALHDRTGAELLFLSPPYTVWLFDGLSAAPVIAGGDFETLLFAVASQHQMVASASVTGGVLETQNYVFSSQHQMVASASVTGGVLDAVLITSASQHEMVASASVTGGVLDAVGISYGPVAHGIVAQASITGGSWT